MNKFKMNAKVAAATVTVLLFLSLTGLVIMNGNNNALSDNLNNQKLKSERLLSEKLLLDKEIAGLKESITSLTGKNAELDKVLANASAKVEKKEQEVARLKKENASLKQFQKQYADLVKIKEDLDRQLTSLSSSIQSLTMEKDALNRTIADLTLKNKSLADELNSMQLAMLDDIRIDAIKKNKMTTVAARKTRKLEMNFIVPANKFSDNLQFRIIDPKGAQLTSNDGTVTYSVSEDNPVYTASLSNDQMYFSQSRQIKLEYVPKNKLKPGIYKIEVLNAENAYMGSLQVKLR
ncbi:MAG: hypothetical protein AB7K37_06125 [Cyclobacteriaceae bacterium]